ncbi:WD-40 repeat-containing protein [Actinidia chinensis var. chinensis]|uniref:WD-40 repeat-containing protein n=1 Tax=Actinidia chinensis var. chinensis TaxID=1590841 RepID=A0A2R6Q522_ACTCC|nr:WD-40 repeat-containing protein [Actinidia chinensis var. chinensis]
MEEALPTPRKRGRPRKDKPKEEREREEPAAAEKMRERADKKSHHSSVVDEKYVQWKSLVPVLYDWLANHNLLWPSLSCRWGPQLEQGKFKNRQRLYLSEQTDGSVPNTLVIANCEVVKSRVAAADHVSEFNEEARSPFVKKYKTIIHPGEVNRIRELPQNNSIIATHTDCPEVLIWDVEAQPNRHAVLGAADSRPDLVLTGHQENAEFALAMCPAEPFVLSGGRDKSVVLWSIQDHVSTLTTDATTKYPRSSGSIIKAADNSSVGPRGIFLGHEDTVEDVQFCPSSAQEFCSVGDDSCLILWDARVGSSPVVKVEKAHDGDLHCVDWNPHDQNLILTGSADHSVCMFDRRNLTSDGVGSLIHKFEGHKAAVLCVQWSPDRSSVFGSSAEDGLLNIWDYDRVGKKKEHATRTPNFPPGLFFQHAGHRDKVVDFHWNAADPWTIVSVSDDCETSGGGGTLQIWRMSDLIYRPEEEVLAELEKYMSHVIECTSKS